MRKKRKIIYLAGFLFSIPIALTSYINSSALEVYIKTEYIGILYAIASFLTILAMMRMPRILNIYGNRKVTLYLSIFAFISLFLLAFSGNRIIFILSFIIFFISGNLIITTLDIFMEDFSKNKSVGTLRGLYLTFINLAWVVSQMISGTIIAKSSFQGIYLFSGIMMTLVSVMFIIFLKDFKDPIYKRPPILRTMRTFLRKKSLLQIYLISFILRFFFAWMIIYTTIYLHEYIGFNWEKIGLIFSIMLLPFILLSYPLGKISDKIGEKRLLVVGFLFAIIFTFIIPFVKEQTVWLWALILFCTRVGAATIEVMSESYFFKIISEEDADEVSFFRNAIPVSYIIAPLFATLFLFLIPSFEYLFYILSIVLLVGLAITLRLKDVK